MTKDQDHLAAPSQEARACLKASEFESVKEAKLATEKKLAFFNSMVETLSKPVPADGTQPNEMNPAAASNLSAPQGTARACGTDGMDLHFRIMNLRGTPEDDWSKIERSCYKIGHRDARHAAAELVASAESIKAELVSALKTMLDAFHEDPFEADHAGAAEKAYEALAKAQGENE